MNLEVVESDYSNPLNDRSGWHVQLKGTRNQVMSDAAVNLALSEAAENGYDPHGQRSIDLPPVDKEYVWGEDMYARSFWFHSQL